MINSVRFHPDGSCLGTGGNDQCVQVSLYFTFACCFKFVTQQDIYVLFGIIVTNRTSEDTANEVIVKAHKFTCYTDHLN
jgi:hypothetical protein